MPSENKRIEEAVSNKNILITGASGFIGSFVTEEALAKGYNVWAGVRKSSSKEFLQDQKIHFIDLNYSNPSILVQQLISLVEEQGNIDYIIHCAGVTKSINESDFHKINYQYSVNLVEAIKQSGCKLKKFIQMSSLSVMGIRDEIGFTPYQATDVPAPNTTYGKSKFEFEEYLEKQKEIPYIVMRPTGVYGPREKDYLMMLKSIKAGINIKAGFTPQQLTFIYVQDLVDATFLALESDVLNKKYFISDGNTYTDNEYSQIIKNLLNKERTINIRIPLCLLKAISFAAHTLSHITRVPSTLNPDKYRIMKQRNWKCNISPIKSDLNFHPKYNLHQGLEKAIEWYKGNGWL